MERNDSAFLNLKKKKEKKSHISVHWFFITKDTGVKTCSSRLHLRSLLFIPHLNHNLLFVPSQLVAMEVIMSLVSHFPIATTIKRQRIWFKEKVGPPPGSSQGPSMEFKGETHTSQWVYIQMQIIRDYKSITWKINSCRHHGARVNGKPTLIGNSDKEAQQQTPPDEKD